MARTDLRSAKKPIEPRCFSFLFLALGLIAFGVAVPVHGAEALDELVATRQLCERGPAATLALAQRLRGHAEITAAGVSANPSLVAEHQRTLSGAVERETIIGVSLPLSVNGRRGLLQEAAAQRARQAGATAHASSFESALAFRQAFATAAMDVAEVQALEEQQRALDELSATIQALSQSGEAAGYDLLRQQAEARLHRARLESARARALASRTLAEQRSESALKLDDVDPFTLAAISGASAVAAPDRESPRLRALESAERASELEARAARRGWLPDLELFGGYRALSLERDTAHGLSLALTVPLTFFDHGQGQAALAEADAALARAEASMLQRQSQAEVLAARARLEQLLASSADIRQASADARALKAQARQLYAAGEATITELLEAFRSAEQLELARLERARELAEARLVLMRAASTMFDASLDAACSAGEHQG
jgi:cobalt-zinc-cadmium efflux system outer membrane protein